jgi:hypothetical protein
MKTTRWPLTIVLVTLAAAAGLDAAFGETTDEAALGRALQGAKTTVEAGLQASEREGQPISGKFEIEDGKLQLSVYTMKNSGYSEVVLDPVTGTIAKTEKITEGDDLKEATVQGAAMGKAKRSLLAATEATVKANAGSRAVGIIPELKDGHPVGVVTLLQGNAFKKVSAPLD